MEFTYQETDKTGTKAHQRTVGPADKIRNHGISQTLGDETFFYLCKHGKMHYRAEGNIYLFW